MSHFLLLSTIDLFACSLSCLFWRYCSPYWPYKVQFTPNRNHITSKQTYPHHVHALQRACIVLREALRRPSESLSYVMRPMPFPIMIDWRDDFLGSSLSGERPLKRLQGSSLRELALASDLLASCRSTNFITGWYREEGSSLRKRPLSHTGKGSSLLRATSCEWPLIRPFLNDLFKRKSNWTPLGIQ